MADFSNSFLSNDSLSELELYCNRDFDSLVVLLPEMQTILDALLSATDRTLDLISCERIVPVYHRAIYDGACEYSVSAVYWFFSASLIMAVFGFLMILLRAAYKPTLYEDVDVDVDAECRVVYEHDDSSQKSSVSVATCIFEEDDSDSESPPQTRSYECAEA